MREQWLIWLSVQTVEGVTVEAGYTDHNFDIPATVDGEARIYEATHGAFAVPSAEYAIGSDQRSLSVTFGATAEFDTLLSGYRISGRPVTLHKATFNDDGDLVALTCRWRGVIDGATCDNSEDGQWTLTLGSLAAVQGTMTEGGMKDHASQLLRDPTDTGMLYAGSKVAVAADEWVIK